jgi:hypothetical protein
MLVGNNQQMTTDVRIEIKYDIVVRSSFDNKITFISIGVLLDFAKDANGARVLCAAAGADVRITPGDSTVFPLPIYLWW